MFRFRYTIALGFSIALHAGLLLSHCDGNAPMESHLEETLVDLQSEEPPEPVVAAPVAASPPPPPPPAAEIPPPVEPPSPDEPSENLRPLEKTPIPPPPNPSPIASTQEHTNTTPSSNATTSQVTGNSEAALVASETLDNRDFKPFGNQKPAYPEIARRMGLEGSATLRILVDSKGSVAQIEVTRWTGHASFASAAEATARTWRFAPPRLHGKPVQAQYTRTIAFRLHE